MKFTHHEIRRNILNWNNGSYNMILEFRGSKEELLEKLKIEIALELDRDKQ